MAEQPTTILLVDDHTLVREGFRAILEAEDDLVVVGEAGDSEATLAQAADKHPHVVLLDIEIPGEDVTSTVTKIHQLSPESQVIILSMYDAPRLVKELLTVGIRGYLHKGVCKHEVISAVRGARVGDARVMLSVSKESLEQVNGSSAGPLSEREREILELTAQALSNTQIASRLYLTETTVKRHLRNIFAKLNAVSRIDAVNKAMDASLIRRADRMPSPRPINRDQ
ncbi:MAG TPA: response regulator transcription factor [Streptosporangiaceae bacterium]|nr:response regulator transcription factor [Streptosporangiaceae bacterium]